ncbi:hypothetical protein [Saccharopolyspora sp. ASAGF58]|nr:hypothetical protein [Saccharopolyspora sp. ASAGF58]
MAAELLRDADLEQLAAMIHFRVATYSGAPLRVPASRTFAVEL